MIAAFLVSILIGQDLMTEPPKWMMTFPTLETCVIAADQLNRHIDKRVSPDDRWHVCLTPVPNT